VPVPGTLTQLALGPNFTCALRSTADVICWGLPQDLGDTDWAPHFPGNPVVGLSGVVQLVGAGSHQVFTGGDAGACALTSSGEVRCWGDNTDGTMPTHAYGADRSVPTTVVGVR
jgi:hypothetical protein